MPGMNRHTGKPLDGLGHIRQSIEDILTTRIGTRIMRRDYGSMLPELIDDPLNEATLLRAYSATVMAILRWEPRARVIAIRRNVAAARPGRATLSMHAITTDNQPLVVDIPLAGVASS